MRTQDVIKKQNGIGGATKNLKPFFQTKLTVNQPGDVYEQEADAIADQVMRMPVLPAEHPGSTMAKIPVSDVQRKCPHCDEEEKLQRKESAHDAGGNAAPDIVSEVVASSGSTLDQHTRGFMESRMGRDFGHVQIHTDAKAGDSATSVNALAYTSGNHVVFGSGQYQPGTDKGKRLLAHELVHVGQQGGEVSKVQREESVYQETVRSPPTATDGVYTGTVTREEFRNETDRAAGRNRIHYGSVNVRFDEGACRLVVPLSFHFVNQDGGHPTTCRDVSQTVSDPVRAVDAAAFEATKARFMRELPGTLNNWFNVELNAGECGPCRSIPIVFDFTEVAGAGADFTVIVTANNGRSYVGNGEIALCGSDAGDMDILTHEGGHFALGWGDEYHENEAKRPVERERLGEHSRMAQDAPNRLLEFHPRHFAFATAFLQSVYPGCNPQLRRTRPAIIDFTVPFTTSYYSRARGNDLGFSLGLQLGIPLTTMRTLSLQLGPQLSYLVDNGEFLAGFRMGLRVQSGGEYAVAGRVFGETGALFDLDGTDRGPFGYAEAGAGVDFRIAFPPAYYMNLSVEGAYGTHGIGSENQGEAFRLGAGIGFTF